ncbi:MAG: hypothetical protein C0508_07510, partial [Cyanobacteria bacterium PR.023]|nr:hypothetical protein [Cyanobacteria bacterium PR.023]
ILSYKDKNSTDIGRVLKSYLNRPISSILLLCLECRLPDQVGDQAIHHQQNQKDQKWHLLIDLEEWAQNKIDNEKPSCRLH